MEEFTVDHEFRKARTLLDEIMRRKDMTGNTGVKRTTLRRNDTAGWLREDYDLKLLVRGRNDNLLLNREEVWDLILDSERPFRKIYGKYKNFWRG